MKRAVERSVAPPPFYFYIFATDHLIKQEWAAMLEAAERASSDGWSFGQAMLAIAHHALSNDEAARDAFGELQKLDPLLAEDPGAWLEGHQMLAFELA